MVALPNVNKKTDPWPYPDPRTLSLIIDPDKVNELLRLEGQVVTLELKPGDIIVNADSMRPWLLGGKPIELLFQDY